MKGPDIAELLRLARQFKSRLAPIKARVREFEWYPYDSLSTLEHLDALLHGEHRYLLDLIGGRTTLDLGCGDGDLAFFLESLGCRMQVLDTPSVSHNGMRGVRALKEALGSQVEIHTVDLDGQFVLPGESYGLVFLLGVLYHLKNPIYVMEAISRQALYCLFSTRIAATLPEGARIRDTAVAYLLDEDELNEDASNYWIFSEAGLRRLLKRTKWELVEYTAVGARESDPVSLERDQRAFCLARSHYGLAHVDLLAGWYGVEEGGNRWTQREFSVMSPPAATRARLKFYLAPAMLERWRSVTLSAAAGGVELGKEKYKEAGTHSYVRELPCGPVRLDFRLDKVLPADEMDRRERGIIVSSLEFETGAP